MGHQRVGFYNENFKMAQVAEEVPFDVTILNYQTRFVLKYGPMKLGGRDYQDTFVLEIDTASSQRAHSQMLCGAGFGQTLFVDYANEATRVAKQFCEERGWQISNEVNHGPVLQFIVFRPSTKPASEQCTVRGGESSKTQRLPKLLSRRAQSLVHI